MICSNCKSEVVKGAAFCPNCGIKLSQINQPQPTMTEKLSNNSKNFVNNIINKIKKHKKILLIIISIMTVLLVGTIIYNKFIGFEKISWDDSYLDVDTKYITQTKLKLGVIISNKDKIDDIKWESDCGEIEGKGLEITWDLSNTIGQCEISASYKIKRIKRNVQIIPYYIEENELNFEYKIDENSDEDLDYDGLTNKEEKEYQTNPQVADTDLDGLDDYYEIFTSKTDPNKKDSDDDGLSDYDEIKLNLFPLKSDSKGDGIKDGDRLLNYDYETDKLKLSIKGKGNIASIVSSVNSNTKISSKEGLIDNLYTLYSDGTIEEAILTISYTDEELIEYGLNEDNLSIYYYNESEYKYEKVKSTIDKANKTVTAKLNHFSSYVLGDSSKVKETNTAQVLFILDNSWSMYTNEQYKEYTGKEYSGGIFDTSELDGFDAKGLRFTLTSELATKLAAKNYQIGLSEFRKDYANAYPIGSDVNSIKEKLSDMTGKFITNNEGTNIGNALIKGVDEFSNDVYFKYIIILTDGQDSTLNSKVDDIIDKATYNNVRICSIGFGGGSYNVELSNISNATGCKFYSSGDSSGLQELFENIGSYLVDGLIDMDGDKKDDGIIIADSGFIVNRDGFSFENYRTNYSNGICYGMATVAELYYRKVLPLSLKSKNVRKDTSFDYNLYNTYLAGNSNLYDYKLKSNSLKYQFGYEYLGEKTPADFEVVNDYTLAFNQKYKEEMTKLGIYDFRLQDSTLNFDNQIKRYGITYNNYEVLLLNLDNIQTSKEITNEELQIFNAIYASYIKQNVDVYFSSASNYIVWLRNFFGKDEVDYKGGKGFINVLKSRLDDKDPVVISSFYDNGYHAINAINLIQDINNPNLYYIGVYDNNYPGEKRYVNIECNGDVCVTRANNYYTNSGQAIVLTPSLEFDLEYYKE